MKTNGIVVLKESVVDKLIVSEKWCVSRRLEHVERLFRPKFKIRLMDKRIIGDYD